MIATAPRTDVHAPRNLITEDYEYAYSYDAHPEEGDQRFTWPLLQALNADGWRFDQVHGGDTCDHCGARLRYVAVLKHVPSHSLIKVGETCLENRFDLATADFHRLRKSAKLNRERLAIVDKRGDFLKVAENREAYEWAQSRIADGLDYIPRDADPYDGESFEAKFVRFVERYGDASDKFVAAILRGKVRTMERDAKRATERADMTPVVAGDAVEITGEIVKLDLQVNDYGSREVMTVKDDRGFLVWGTQPKSLYDAGKGSRVSFTAQVERSDRDASFGFFKRPKRAKIL